MHVREFPSQEEAHRVLHEEDPHEMTPYVSLNPNGTMNVGVYIPKSFDVYTQDKLRSMLADVVAKVNANPPDILKRHATELAHAKTKLTGKRPDELTKNQRKKIRQLSR
jgi:hypothetical protein